MSADLIQDYFRRDLDAAEEEALAQQLQASPEAAERFAALAAGDYKGFALPEPGQAAQGGGRARWLALLAIGIGLATAGTVLWKGRPDGRGSVAVIQDAQDDGFAVVERPEPARPAEAPSAAPAEAARLLVQAQTPRGPFEVRVAGAKAQSGGVFNAQGRRVADLVMLDSRHFRWDGRLEDGKPAGAGPYQLRLDAEGRQLRQWVEIEVR